MNEKRKRRPVWKRCMIFDMICVLLVLLAAGGGKIEEKTAQVLNVESDAEEPPAQTEKESQEKKKIALTFDDGPHPVYTPLMLDGLKERNVKATFFLLGSQAEKHPEIVKRMGEEGHLIGNHSYVHEQLSKLSNEQACLQVNRTNEVIYEITGKYPAYLRPPFGDWKDKLDCEVNMIEVLWDIDTLDWSSQNRAKIVNKVVTKVKEGDIILMHDSYEPTVEAAMEIIDTLQKQGYEFVTVDELILE